VKAVQLNVVGVQCCQAVAFKDLLGNFAGHLAHVRADLGELAGQR